MKKTILWSVIFTFACFPLLAKEEVKQEKLSPSCINSNITAEKFTYKVFDEITDVVSKNEKTVYASCSFNIIGDLKDSHGGSFYEKTVFDILTGTKTTSVGFSIWDCWEDTKEIICRFDKAKPVVYKVNAKTAEQNGERYTDIMFASPEDAEAFINLCKVSSFLILRISAHGSNSTAEIPVTDFRTAYSSYSREVAKTSSQSHK